MINNLLCLPLFQVADIPLKETLAQLIKKDFFQSSSAFASDLDNSRHLHTALAQYSTADLVDFPQYQTVITKFYNFVEDVSRRFPENSVSFEWFSTLRYLPASRIVSTWKHEQAYLVYQLGAVLCQRAHGENILHDEGVKQACLLFKQSAGCFEHLLSLLKEDSASPQDLNEDTVAALRLMMLAQSQELVWLKAVSNPQIKDSLVARLSKTVADLYEQAIALALQSNTIILDWINIMRVKMNHFLAASYYRMALVALDNFEYGQQVTYLKAASEKCADALKSKRYVGLEVLEDLQGLIESVESFLRTAEKENDLVFLKPVPAFQQLAAIEPVSLVEPDVPKELAASDRKPAFASLVPFSIIQIAQAFKDREESYTRQTISEPLMTLGRMLRQFLAEHDLPAIIDTIQKPDSVPDSILSHLEEIISKGGVRIIEDSMSEISELAVKCKHLISECEERLRMENYEYELLRQRAGSSQWNREPSLVVAAHIHTKIEKMTSYIRQGHESDIVIGQSYELIKAALEIFCGGKVVLKKKIPNSSYIKLNSEMAALVNELKELIAEANRLETTRQRFISGVEGKSRNYSVLPLILGEYKRNPEEFQLPSGTVDPVKFEPIYEKQLQHYIDDVVYVESLKEKQRHLERRIDEATVRFARSRETLVNTAQEKRLRTLQYLESAYVQNLELIANLNRASVFYNDLFEKGKGVLREIDDFLYSRREEVRQLTLELENQQKFNQIEKSMAQT